MSTSEKPKPEETPKAKPRSAAEQAERDDARALELIMKHGLQRLLTPKR